MIKITKRIEKEIDILSDHISLWNPIPDFWCIVLVRYNDGNICVESTCRNFTFLRYLQNESKELLGVGEVLKPLLWPGAEEVWVVSVLEPFHQRFQWLFEALSYLKENSP